MPAPGGERLLLLGASVRALAQSALASDVVRRRFPGGCLAIDFFGDADLRDAGSAAPIEVIALARDAGLPRSVAHLGRAALGEEWDAFLPAGGLENRPGLLRLLERRGRPLGPGSGAVRAVRNPEALMACLAAEGLGHARVARSARVPPGAGDWLLKPRRGAGGGSVRPAVAGEPVPPGFLLQERLEGRVGSAAFLADGRAAVLLGVSEQITGWAALGADGYRHVGSLFDTAAPWTGPDGMLSPAGTGEARRIAGVLAARFGVTGLAGFDFIAVSGRPRLIEVNPRWTASMELYDESRPGSLVDAAIRVADGAAAERAAAEHGLPGPGPARIGVGAPAVRARGVLYAAETTTAPEPALLEAIGARDRPHAGEIVDAGRPICTLTASAATRAEALARLEAAAGRVRALLVPFRTVRPPDAAVPFLRP